jgi:hypothetical protein
MARLENLKVELTDIDWMDRFYWQTKNPEQHEKLGYLVRQVRRRDVIAELLKLMQEAVKRESAPDLLPGQGCPSSSPPPELLSDTLILG